LIKLDFSKIKYRWIGQEGVSSNMTKVEMAKDIYLQMWFIFDIWCGKLCHLDGANSIKTALWACNLWTGLQAHNWFWKNLPCPNSKKFSTSNIKNNSHLLKAIPFVNSVCMIFTVKSLTSEATHSATPFFKRAYKINHSPGL
jgi:hypothetical protein